MLNKITKKAFFKKLIDKFSKDGTTTLAASLAYYSALSVAPILLLFVAISSKLNFGVTQVFLKRAKETLGTEAAKIIENIIQHSKEETDFASFASWISIFALLLSASLVFSQIQMALNKIFKEKNPTKKLPSSNWGILFNFLKKKFFYSISVLAFIILLIATISTSSLIFKYIQNENIVPAFITSIVSSIFIYTSIFTFMYRYIPKSKRAWKFSFYGGILTAIFFVLGTQIISIYLGNSEIGLAFGASGSLLIFLVWVYYSSITILVGAQVSSLLININSKGRLR